MQTSLRLEESTLLTTPRVRARYLLPLLVVLLVIGFCYRSPWSASNLETVPDSVEYAVAAQRFVLTGHYNIVINGVVHPPRYPPWFSVLILAPLYALAPGELGIGILAVLGFAVALALLAYLLGYRLAGELGGCLAAIAVVFSIVFMDAARQIMMDIPAAACGLFACWMFLRIYRQPTRRDYLLAGIAIALAVGLRNTNALLLAPFLCLAVRQRQQALARLALLLLPVALLTAATLVYNQSAFGDWRRNGYEYWCAVPYDYLGLTFSPAYIARNLHDLSAPDILVSLALGAIGIAIFRKERQAELGPILIFLALAAVPMSLLYLFYFALGQRFHLIALSLLRVLGAAGLATLIPETFQRRVWLLPALVGALALLAALGLRTDPEPLRREIAEAMAQALPKNAVIITAIDPVYLEPTVLRGTQRQVVPSTRGVEYASKLVTPRRVAVLDPPARSPKDHRAPGLRRGGAYDACPYTADEALDRIADWVRAGVPVYLDSSPVSIGTPAWKQLHHRYYVVADTPYPWLERLTAPR